jgi:hypothetical protein
MFLRGGNINMTVDNALICRSPKLIHVQQCRNKFKDCALQIELSKRIINQKGLFKHVLENIIISKEEIPREL